MFAAGLRPEDFEGEDEVLIWPDNWQAWELFREMRTQWRVGVGGPTGLDYGPLFTRLDRLCPDPEAWERLYAEIRDMEAAAIEQMAEDAESNRP